MSNDIPGAGIKSKANFTLKPQLLATIQARMADILHYFLILCHSRCCYPSWPLSLLSQMRHCNSFQQYLSHDNSHPLEIIGIIICYPYICCLPTGDKLYLSATGRIGSRLLLALANDIDAQACTFSFVLNLFRKKYEI